MDPFTYRHSPHDSNDDGYASYTQQPPRRPSLMEQHRNEALLRKKQQQQHQQQQHQLQQQQRAKQQQYHQQQQQQQLQNQPAKQHKQHHAQAAVQPQDRQAMAPAPINAPDHGGRHRRRHRRNSRKNSHPKQEVSSSPSDPTAELLNSGFFAPSKQGHRHDNGPQQSRFGTSTDNIQELVEAAFGDAMDSTPSSPAPKPAPKLTPAQAPSPYIHEYTESDSASAATTEDENEQDTGEEEVENENMEAAMKEQHTVLDTIAATIETLSQELDKIMTGQITNKKQILMTEENLTKAMLKIDSVESFGSSEIRQRRKELIRRSETLLEAVDEFKSRNKPLV